MTRKIALLLAAGCVSLVGFGCESNENGESHADTSSKTVETTATQTEKATKDTASKAHKTASQTYQSGVQEISNISGITKAKDAPKLPAAAKTLTHKISASQKPGFMVEEEDNILWVLRPGQEKQEKAISLIGKGPGGMTLRAIDRDTAIQYLGTKPGFVTEVEDGRLWVMKPGQKKSDKHITLVGKGPLGTTVKAPDRDTAVEYLATKPGFVTMVDEGWLWVLEPGDKPKEKHVSYVAAGPLNTTVKANSRETGLAYFAAEDGFITEVEDGRIWVLAPGEEKAEKHVTRINAGPRGTTLKGVNRETLDRYVIAINQD